ncbi:MAG: polyphosphate polymerase domain-containing protein [Chitinophagales bacterium]|nr:polyphosphate polymerase domain-containing protein [Chitinophagales bacterium]MDW8427407.1 polyphosphate polymerase domain-containing protein [Chitinophagales bacterium]
MNIISNPHLREIENHIQSFASSTLEELGTLHLHNRFDEKYLFLLKQLPAFLEQLRRHYRVVKEVVPGCRRYNNLYFDTPELTCYLMHHNDRANRYKIRFRQYVSTGHCFLEIKKKLNKGLTTKVRMPAEQLTTWLTNSQKAFLAHQEVKETDRLVPSLYTFFNRITLISIDHTERITLDYDLSYQAGDRILPVPQLVVAEVKQQQPAYHSPFRALMLHQRIFPVTFSKYCMGIVLTHPWVKHNRFKPRLLYFRRLLNGSLPYEPAANL